MTAPATLQPLLLLISLLLLVWLDLTAATNVTSTTDYGFGPLWVSYTPDTLSRCSNVSFTFGGGLGPYSIASVNAANVSANIPLETNTTAEWQIELSMRSHVAFNVTARTGASVQTPFLEVKGDDKSCANDTAYTLKPTDSPSGGSPTAIALSGHVVALTLAAGLAGSLTLY